MKVEISQLGVIKEASIELKPLTVFIGDNGTGKTWTAYTLASIFGKNGFERYFKAYIEGNTIQKYSALDNAVEELIESGNSQINISEFVDKNAELYINDVSFLAKGWMSEFLATERTIFDDLEVKIDLCEAKVKILEKVKKYELERETSFISKATKLNVLKEKDEDNIYFYFIYQNTKVSNEDIKVPKAVLRKIVKDFVYGVIFNLIHKCFYSYLYIFPTERTTYIGFPFALKNININIRQEVEKIIESVNESNLEQDNEFTKSNNIDQKQENEVKVESAEENLLGEQLLEKFIEIIKLLGEENGEASLEKDKQQKRSGKGFAVHSLIEIIGSASMKTEAERQEEIKDNPRIADYISLANFLSNNILYGNIKFDKSKLQNEIIFQPSESTSLEMQVASSMVKELAPLYLCLRYLVEPNELLIIDEPEMNLHPAAQVEIIEFLAMLVQAGLNVLITTHSPYIVDHLANLMQAAKHNDKEGIKEKFYLERTEAFIPEDKVSVYLFENGTAKNILNEEGRIDWETFGNVSDDISHIFP